MDTYTLLIVGVALIILYIFFRLAFRNRGGRRSTYARLVAWVETHYGKIDEQMTETDIRMKFDHALQEERLKNGDKAVAGLQRYVELQKYKDLVKKKEE